MTSDEKRIGLFGGSFDPVHYGHISAAHSFLESNMIHELWIIPSPDPPHKQEKSLTSFHHRKKMLEMVFRDQESISISSIEKELPRPSYTLQTLEFLQEKYGGVTFYLCMGSDSLGQFKSWHKYRDILDRVTLLVAERKGVESDTIPDDLLDHAIFIDHKPVDSSSSDIRITLRNHSEESKELDLPESVARYITDNQLYKN